MSTATSSSWTAAHPMQLSSRIIMMYHEHCWMPLAAHQPQTRAVGSNYTHSLTHHNMYNPISTVHYRVPLAMSLILQSMYYSKCHGRIIPLHDLIVTICSVHLLTDFTRDYSNKENVFYEAVSH